MTYRFRVRDVRDRYTDRLDGAREVMLWRSAEEQRLDRGGGRPCSRDLRDGREGSVSCRSNSLSRRWRRRRRRRRRRCGSSSVVQVVLRVEMLVRPCSSVEKRCGGERLRLQRNTIRRLRSLHH